MCHEGVGIAPYLKKHTFNQKIIIILLVWTNHNQISPRMCGLTNLLTIVKGNNPNLSKVQISALSMTEHDFIYCHPAILV